MKQQSKLLPYLWELYDGDGVEQTSDELQQLHNFLRISSLPGGCTSLAMADGFLAALVVLPPSTQLQLGQGLPMVWGEETNDTWGLKKRTTQNKYILSLLENRIFTIHGQLALHPLDYAPFINGGSQELPSIVEWCRGFMKAFARFDREIWAPIFESKNSRALIAPFIYFGTEDGWSIEKEEKYNLRPYRDRFYRDHASIVCSIKSYFYSLWHARDMKKFQRIVAPHWNMPTSADQVNLRAT